MKLHPDKNMDNKDATKNFQDLREVFEVLSNPKKRRLYDQGGEESLKRAKSGGGGGGYRTYTYTYHHPMDPLNRFYAREANKKPSLIDRIFWRFIDETLDLFHYVTSSESFLTFVILTICALITSLILYRSPSSCNTRPQHYEDLPKQHHHQQQENTNHDNNADAQSPNTSQTATLAQTSDDLKVLELKAETYNGMIRLLKPGFRSIILLTDRETKEKLLPQFKRAVWPYRRNKTLLFGYLCLDKNLDWYKSLLQEVTGISDLNVNKRNCNGTVLSLNGFKKYFRVYHAKHHEQSDYHNEVDEDEGSFLGFGEQDHDNDDVEASIGNCLSRSDDRKPVAPPLVVDNLLDRLPIWLDKMFDGMTKRYFLDSWPEEIK